MVVPEGEVKSSKMPVDIVGLVGPSGTGKSHHAMWIAKEHGCDAIIDDGLLIYGSRIAAGKSAKRENSMTGAVRRAIFHAPSHVVEVREAIDELKPKAILVLGTSNRMIDRICQRLLLPAPRIMLEISEFATKEEIDIALWQRRQEGKHVIPAPAFEVKKTFSGYLVDPLKIFTRTKKDLPYLERSVVRPTYSYFGHFYIADGVVMQIAHKVCLEVSGVKRVLRILVLSTGDGVHLDAELVLSQGMAVFPVMEAVQERLKERLEYLTGIYLMKVNVITKKIGLE